MKLPDISEIYKAYMYSYPHKTEYGPLENVFDSWRGVHNPSLQGGVVDYLASCGMGGIDFYFHIPFCVSKCGYCNLFSVTGQSGEVLDSYLSAMKSQISQYGAEKIAPLSFTIGGGTPLTLSEKQLDIIFNMLPDIQKSASCIETAPNETTEAKLKVLKMYEIDRVSIGVQSFIDDELKTLERAQSAQSARRALELLKKYGFPFLNIDLIYGIPGQTLLSSKASIAEALKFCPEELFIYPLYIREGTSIYAKFGSGYKNPQIYDMYMEGRALILEAGYTQVSMRRFVKKPPVHQKTCGFNDILSIGCGGRSYLGNLHFCHPFTMENTKRLRIIEDYINASDKTRIVNGYVLNSDEQKRRFVIKNLLHVNGLPFACYMENFHADLYEDFPVLKKFFIKNYITESEGRIQLTELGLSLSDYIGPALAQNQQPRPEARTRKRAEGIRPANE